MINKLVWVPRNIKVSNSNPQGPKMEWVPKCPPINSSIQKISQKEGQIGLANGRSSRRILPRLDGKSLCQRKEEIPTKTSQIHNGKLQKFKTQQEK